MCPYVAQAYVYGDSLKSCAVAIIVPDEETLLKWAEENNISGSFADLCVKEVGVAYGVLSDV